MSSALLTPSSTKETAPTWRPIILEDAAAAGPLTAAEATAPAIAFCMKLRLFMVVLGPLLEHESEGKLQTSWRIGLSVIPKDLAEIRYWEHPSALQTGTPCSSAPAIHPPPAGQFRSWNSGTRGTVRTAVRSSA